MKTLSLLLVALFLFAFFGCARSEPKKLEWEEVSFNTSDGQIVSALFYKNGTIGKGVVLIHMLGKDKHGWNEYAPVLQAMGYDVLAIDLRGHGKSAGNYELFQIAEFQRMPFDAKAGADYLRAQGDSEVCLVGASIGANVALKYAASDERIRKVALISPGLEYSWLNIEEDAKDYSGEAYLLASNEDEYSAQSVMRLQDLMEKRATAEFYNGYGHGTEMLHETFLIDRIGVWLRGNGFPP